jgi:hypothetical protein
MVAIPSIKWHGSSATAIGRSSSSYDIAEANLEQANGLPGAANLDIPRCLRWADDAAGLVGFQTERHLYRFQKEPEKYSHSEGVFRMLWLVSVLQRDLHAHYRYEVTQLDDHAFFSDAANVFIHGIAEGKGGTCSSLPVMYAAVGRRLGYPLSLVHNKKHAFLRWDGLNGERFNIECSGRGFLSHPDDFYLTWPCQTTPEEIKRCGLLQSMTTEEEIAVFQCRRGIVWMENGRYGQAMSAYLRAYHHMPGRQATLNGLHRTLTAWGKEVRGKLMPGFPSLEICHGPRLHPDLPDNVSAEVNYLNAVETLLENPVGKAHWWDPLRRNPLSRPVGLPERIRAIYSQESGTNIKYEPC